MRMISKVATAATITAVAMGASAAGASAYTVSGGAVSGVNTTPNTFSINGSTGPTIRCTIAQFSGNATGLAYVDVVPYFSGCALYGAPVAFSGTVTVSGLWRITPTAGAAPNHTGTLSGLGSVVTFQGAAPIGGCVITIGSISGTGMSSTKPVGSGERISASITGATTTVSGPCPGVPNGTFPGMGTYSTGPGYIQTASPITIAP